MKSRWHFLFLFVFMLSGNLAVAQDCFFTCTQHRGYPLGKPFGPFSNRWVAMDAMDDHQLDTGHTDMALWCDNADSFRAMSNLMQASIEATKVARQQAKALKSDDSGVMSMIKLDHDHAHEHAEESEEEEGDEDGSDDDSVSALLKKMIVNQERILVELRQRKHASDCACDEQVSILDETEDRNGSVINYSSKWLWVVETDSGSAVAHKLAPLHRSPRNVDADGVKAVDGTKISRHSSWWKFRVFEVEIKDDAPDLKIIRCIYPACKTVEENEFGTVRYDNSTEWGVPLLGP